VSYLATSAASVKRDACAACGSSLTEFLDLGSSPLADVFPADISANERSYPLTVAICASCWLAQLRDIVPDDELYGEDYEFRTGKSPALIKYFNDLAAKLLATQDNRFTVEIACNDGTLLRHFTGYRPVLGVEPSAAADNAEIRGIPVVKQLFTSALADEIVEQHGRAGTVIACNVLAHVTDPLDFLRGVCTLLADDGVAVIEFQDLARLIAGCQYDHVYHEHRFYLSITSLNRLAAKSGLRIQYWEQTEAQGGSLRVMLARGNGQLSINEPWLEDLTTYMSLQNRVEYAKNSLKILISDELADGRVVAGWGASAKSATLLNYCQLTSREIKWVEDVTPGKIGKFTPGSHIPIHAPGTSPDTFLMLAWNYAGGMIRRDRAFFDGGGRLIIPGAVPVIV
jgi:hypothetical protein